MSYNKIFPNEIQCKLNYNTLSFTRNDSNFRDCLNRMAKLTVYFLMYSGVPKEVIPLVISRTNNYTVDYIRKDLYKNIKNNRDCIMW